MLYVFAKQDILEAVTIPYVKLANGQGFHLEKVIPLLYIGSFVV